LSFAACDYGDHGAIIALSYTNLEIGYSEILRVLGIIQDMGRCKMWWMIGSALWLGLISRGCAGSYPAKYELNEAAPPIHCYTATGHTVQGNFLRYFEASGGVDSLGYPIAEPLIQEGRLVQYFEYARLEDHPDNPGQPVVKLSMLGVQLGRRQPPISPSRVPPASDGKSRYYPQMGHSVSGDFLRYFEAHGGVDRFGYPIAEPSVAEGKLVQDFQRARFVWHLDLPPEQRVTLEPSGRVLFETQSLDPTLLVGRPCPPGSQIVEPD
jgi:hypothetical protein